MVKSLQPPRVLLLIDTAGAVGRDMVRGIARYALENGPWTIQFEYRALESIPPQWLKQWRGDGIISRTIDAKQGKVLRSVKLPLVELIGHSEPSAVRIATDFTAESSMVVDYFLDCGLRQFAFFTLGQAWWLSPLRDAFQSLLASRGFGCHMYESGTSMRNMPVWHETQKPAITRWIGSLPRPIGVLTPGDLHAVRLLEMCRELGVAVPEEIAILGRGNDPLICETVRPTLSSVDLDAQRIGFEAARILDRTMSGKSAKGITSVPPSRVVVRQSTDLVAIQDADVAQAVRLIRESACTGLDVARIAEDIGLSRRALERRFQQSLGRSPKAEIMRVRIEHAKMLLAQTDKTVALIAHKCGFCSLEYFATVFRGKVCMRPQAYRKMQRISREWNNEIESIAPAKKSHKSDS